MIEQARVTLIEDFTRTALQISCGQHADLVGGASSLEQCWEIVDAKSGACFALACRSGATLAGVDPEIIGYYSQFGHHLGVAIQIIDDLQGIGESNGAHSDLVVGKRTLPVWYTLSVTSPESQARLLHCLHAAPHDPMAEALARNLIEESGAALYLSIEARSHGIQALACLNMANPQVAPRDQLVRLLTKVCPI